MCAQAQAQIAEPPASVGQAGPATESENTDGATAQATKRLDEVNDLPAEKSNDLGVQLLKNLAADQKAIWTSPSHLRWADGAWLFPLAAATGGFFATDRAVPPALSSDPHKLKRYVSVSNYGLYSMIGAGGGLYVWSKIITHNEHERETGILAGEAAIDSLVVDTTFKYAFGRARPEQDQGLGNFFQHGTSFPSDHSALAWSIASVIAHEYPGVFTQAAAYGMATAVSASRAMGKQHFPSDVVVGAAIGWLIGRQVYRAHHDPELGGGGWEPLSGNEDGEDNRDRRKMGSAFVPLDSWVYDAFERLAGLGYAQTAMMGLKPWTRIECARIVEEAGETLEQDPNSNEEAARLQISLAREFNYEIALLSGGHNLSANLESLYARAVSISGPPLTDGYHFGQTIAYDFGRPFERGTNAQTGGSFRAEAGPLAIYVRAEYQHAPAAPAPSSTVVNFIAAGDVVSASQVPAGPVAATNRVNLLDSYIAVNMNNWQLELGRQSLSWAPGAQSMIWNDNIQPIDMVRLVNPESFFLPGFLHHVGPIRIDQFFGRLGGHPYFPRPFVFGQKVNFKPLPFLEIGFGRRTTLGGAGSGTPLTAGNLINAVIGRATAATATIPGSVPGDTDTEMDWTFQVPKTRNYVVLYGDAYAEDDILPIERPARNPWHPGIYITRFPGLPKLDLHVEGVSTEAPGAIGGGNHGDFIYWNYQNPDANTNFGSLIGNTVGRDGRSIQAWLHYWISPTSTVSFTYRHNSVSPDFVPQGAAWQDYTAQGQTYLRSGFYVKAQVQYENISRYPILFKGPQSNVTGILEIGFYPGERRAAKSN